MDNERNHRIIARQSELVVRVVGTSQINLFVNAAFALFDVITDTEKIDTQERLQLEVEGSDRDDLLLNWLRELLYLYQGSAFLLKEFNVQEMKDTSVKAQVGGEKLDPDRHEIKQEIAAVAYDQSHMQKTGDQWIAQVILEV
jgi:SHS2 domain-containing protein